jgi:hypothetical protein
MKEQGGREMIRARKETHLKFQDYKRKMREKKKFRTWIHVGVILASSFPSKSHFTSTKQNKAQCHQKKLFKTPNFQTIGETKSTK